MREAGLIKRLEDPKDLNDSFRVIEGKTQDKRN